MVDSPCFTWQQNKLVKCLQLHNKWNVKVRPDSWGIAVSGVKVILSDKVVSVQPFQFHLYSRAFRNPSLHMMTFMIWPKGRLNIIGKAIGWLLLRTVLSLKWEAMTVFLPAFFYGKCWALCEIVGWINTASLRISSIQDNLIPAERAPQPKALDVNDKKLRLLPREARIFSACASLFSDKRGNDVEKHKAVPRLISPPLLLIWHRSLRGTNIHCHITTKPCCGFLFGRATDETKEKWTAVCF